MTFSQWLAAQGFTEGDLNATQRRTLCALVRSHELPRGSIQCGNGLVVTKCHVNAIVDSHQSPRQFRRPAAERP